jgi:NADH-quinone oxidoreductase subunit L
MQKMGSLKKYMPVTFVTMMIGTLAIAGIPPFSGFFSKDEILYRTFLGNRMLWVLAVATALMTAFYMLRLMMLTFYGSYRGVSWATSSSHAAATEAAVHGVGHPLDAHAHGQAQKKSHEVTHGAADVLVAAPASHGHAWHGPHESPRAMTVPLMALAIGAMVAGFVGIPQVLGGRNSIEHFLEPSFMASAAAHEAAAEGPVTEADSRPAATNGQVEQAAQPHAAPSETHGAAAEGEPHSSAAELGLMFFSVLIAIAGILTARHFYLSRPEIPGQLVARFRGAHALLFNKYYVDELYDATAIQGTLTSGRGLWTFDRRVVDGAVNGSGWLTRLSAWASHMVDKHVVDGLVNLVGWTAGQGSFFVRRLQTGLVQNYALLMVFGVFAFLTLYLIAR